MTMVSTGQISIGGNATSGGLNRSVNIELGRSATATSSLNESSLRTLAGVPTGAISLSNFYGKANAFAFTISSNQVNANLRTLAVNAGWNQSSAVQATVAAGVYIYSTSTSTPGLTINGSFPGGVTLTNNGFIMGMGGETLGGSGVGSPGGPAISLGVNCSIVNNSYIGGGGGSGAYLAAGGGGGAGGGAGQSFPGTSGGAGGGPGSAGGDGWFFYAGKFGTPTGTGGGGGRIMPGTGGAGGTFSSGNAGGRGGGAGGGGGSYDVGQAAGAGGSGGAAGQTVSGFNYSGAGGGGWGAAGGNAVGSSGTGGAGGKAINLNGFTATRTGSGTTYGTVS